jgi:hypothetical protein
VQDYLSLTGLLSYQALKIAASTTVENCILNVEWMNREFGGVGGSCCR